MHSRVAAVKAPRTHNRRRVTGSSGGRREGRESERQRPNMSRRVFTSAVLLLLVVMLICCGSEVAYGNEGNLRNGIIFKGGDPFNDAGNKCMVQTFGLFRAPSLAYTKAAVVAVVGAHYTNTADNKVCVGSAANSIGSDKRTWTKGSAIVFDHYDIKVDRLSRPTAIVYDGDITAVVGGYGNSGAPLTRVAGDDYWTPRMAEGEAPHDDEDENKKEFAWHRRVASNLESFLEVLKFIPEHIKQFLGAGGGGIRLEDNSSVLPTHALKDNGKAVSLVILAKGFAYGWELSKDTSPAGCIQPAVLAWKENKLVRMASREDGSRGVHTWDVMGESVDRGIRHSFTRVGQLTDTCGAWRAGWLRQRDDRWTESHPRQPAGIFRDGR
ncbi:trans-sialidase, putative [Trypanosoma cruzi marinkellei]|uniref:Trans-sialidase, putative n=1 Tax=Trypanosoma cruzi marinkellei TaxID=85056 RepID=K2NHV0_TRYCR|nr:trans-sialidase, putative [Trypanosoma cruzi marinkellei]